MSPFDSYCLAEAAFKEGFAEGFGSTSINSRDYAWRTSFAKDDFDAICDFADFSFRESALLNLLDVAEEIFLYYHFDANGNRVSGGGPDDPTAISIAKWREEYSKTMKGMAVNIIEHNYNVMQKAEAVIAYRDEHGCDLEMAMEAVNKMEAKARAALQRAEGEV